MPLGRPPDQRIPGFGNAAVLSQVWVVAQGQRIGSGRLSFVTVNCALLLIRSIKAVSAGWDAECPGRNRSPDSVSFLNCLQRSATLSQSF